MTEATMTKPLTGMIQNPHDLIDIAQYEKLGGYQAIKKAVGKMQPQEVTKQVTDSGLKGRGGAGFSTGVKWSLVPMGPDAPKPKYLVCNADEMEPGTFKDRLLLECNPHQLIEGMILAAYAIQATDAYIFIRGEYKLSEKRVGQALKEAYAKGYLGKNILGSGFDLEMHLHMSAGRYMCGEETGLLNSLEGKRANPRSKPPFPQISGLWGKPTIVNNVETLSNISHIINNGASWFKGLSKSDDSGTKIYGVSGKVKRPGLWELPLGATIREIMDLAGGMQDGVKFKGVLPGGASTDFLVEQHLDVKMDYKSVAAAGSRLGTGTMIVLDDRTCPIGMILNLEIFFSRESCGWCTPCREGLPWTAKVLQALEDGHGIAADLHRLDLHTRLLGPGKTFCALAPGAMEPLQSGLKYFKDDFDYHIKEKHCPWK